MIIQVVPETSRFLESDLRAQDQRYEPSLHSVSMDSPANIHDLISGPRRCGQNGVELGSPFGSDLEGPGGVELDGDAQPYTTPAAWLPVLSRRRRNPRIPGFCLQGGSFRPPHLSRGVYMRQVSSKRPIECGLGWSLRTEYLGGKISYKVPFVSQFLGASHSESQ